MKAYKGFNKDMTCRDFKYEEGKEYTHDGNVSVCNSGFHACVDPLDCFRYYDPTQSVYHEVEADGEVSAANDDSKVACSKIKIGAAVNIAGIVKAHVEYVKSRTNYENTDPKMATAGYRGAATAGSYGAATAGDSGAATAGYRGAATAGDSGAATSRGSSAVGENGIACARGNGCRVKGGLGAILVIAEEAPDDYNIVSWKAKVVDGEKIKADTWYCIKNGRFVEAQGGEA